MSIKNIFRLKKDNSVLTPEQLRKKEALMRKILTYVNVFIVALIALVLYMAYETYVDQPKAGDAISAIKDKLPVKFDDYTTLEQIVENKEGVTLTIEKSLDEFAGLDLKDQHLKLQKYLNQSKNLCSISILKQIIENGKQIKVIIKTDFERAEKVLTVETCK